MKQCPLCMGQIPDAAAKCQHCGEWVDGRPSSHESELGQAANRFINYKMGMSIIGLVMFLLIFLLVWLPAWKKTSSNFENFPTIPLLPK